MRKHFTTALESRDYGYGVAMEDEEVAVVTDEANADANAVASDLTEAERIIEVSDALEDLAVIADGIDEATPAEVALIENAGNIAVAGTDVQPEEVVPAMESYLGRKISTEGIREVARTIWENIKRFLKNIWDKIESFFYKIFGTIPTLRRNIESMKKRIEETVDAGKRAGKDKVKVTSGVTALSINYVPAKTEGDLVSGMGSLTDYAKYVFGAYVTEIASTGEVIAKAIGDFDAEKPTDAIGALRKHLDSRDYLALPKSTSGAASRFPGFTVKTSNDLFGNVVLASITFDDKKDNSDLASLDRYRRTRMELISSSEKEKSGPSEFEMTTMSTAGMEKLLDESIKLIDMLEAYKRGSKMKDVQKTRDSIKSASEKAEKAMGKAKDSDDVASKAAVPYYKAMLNFNAAYARWSQTPAMPFLNHSLTTVRAILSLVGKNLSNYKVNP